jgi:putative MFS transporter
MTTKQTGEWEQMSAIISSDLPDAVSNGFGEADQDHVAKHLQQQLDEMPLNRRHWLVFGVCSAGMLFDSLDLQLMSFAAPLIMKEWSMTPELLGTVISAAVIGMIVGTYLFGTMADWVGRRTAFQITVGIFSVFTGLAAYTSTLTQLAAARFIAGLGIGGSIPVDTLVLTEFVPSRSRGRMMAFWAIFFSLGGLLAPVCAWIIIPEFGWRGLFLVGALPALIVFLIRWLIPETPRYLLMKRRHGEARASIAWISGRNIDSSPMAQPNNRLSSEDAAANKFSPFALFSREHRKQTVLSWLIWFGWGFSYFGLILWLPTLLIKYRGIPQSDVLYFMMGFAVAGIAGRVLMLGCVDWLGRKPVIIACGLLAFATMQVFAHQTDPSMIILWGYLTAFFLDGGFSAIVPYVPELFPTRARGTGLGWAQGMGRVASAVAPVIVGMIVATSLNSTFVVLSLGALITAAAIILLGRETKGVSLAD